MAYIWKYRAEDPWMDASAPSQTGRRTLSHKHPNAECHPKAMPHNAPGACLISSAAGLGGLHSEASGQGCAQSAEQPGHTCHNARGSRGVGIQMAQHGRVDVLHDYRGDLGPHGRQ